MKLLQKIRRGKRSAGGFEKFCRARGPDHREGAAAVKWVNHMIVTGAVVYAVTADPLLALYSVAGSVFPDKLEGRPPKSKKAYWQWRKKHRTWTHWTVPYLSLITAILVLHHAGMLPAIVWPLALIILFFLTGALLHIVEDALCGKVPLISPGKKIGIKLFTVDSPGEYFFSFVLSAALLLYRGNLHF